MTSKYKFLVCGNDMRQAEIAKSLFNTGYNTATLNINQILPDEIIKYIDIQEAFKFCNCIILPMPCSNDGNIIKGTDLTVDEFISSINPGTIVFGGKLPVSLKQNYLNAFDYYEREELAIYNAIPTAEGALQLAMEMLPVTIHGCRCLVLGYGRIGKIISLDLKKLGAFVDVEARKQSDFAWIIANGLNYIKLSDLSEYIDNYRLIINTVPNLILNAEILTKVRKDAVIIDLASKPGGVDFDYALRAGLKAIHALSLPSKVSPVTAGIIVKNTIINMLEEMEV